MCNCRKSSNGSLAATPVQNYSTYASPSYASLNKRRVNRPTVATAPVIPAQLSEINGASVAEKRQTFAYMLGLEEPVSEAVLLCAVESPSYARSLMNAMNQPARLNDLLTNPPHLRGTKATFSNANLVAKAGTALMKWAVAGFPTVSKSVLETREDACLACPELKAPTNTLQQLTASSSVSEKIGRRTGNKSCQACGCVITNKIRLATESCPLACPDDFTVNRWGEPLKTA